MRRRTPAVDIVDLGDIDPLLVQRARVLDAAGVAPGGHVQALASKLGITELELRVWSVAYDAGTYGLDVGAEVAEYPARHEEEEA